MRASVLKNDPGYVSDSWNYKVFLDGKKLKNCVTADEELGEVVVYDAEAVRHGEDHKYETLKGVVKIVKTETKKEE